MPDRFCIEIVGDREVDVVITIEFEFTVGVLTQVKLLVITHRTELLLVNVEMVKVDPVCPDCGTLLTNH